MTTLSSGIEFYLHNGNVEHHLELLEMSEACLWLIDRQFTLLSFNKIYVKHMQLFANVTPRIGEKDTVLACFPKEFAEGILKLYQKAMAGEEIRIMDKGFKEDGTETDVMMVFKPVLGCDGSVTSVSCMRKDISEFLQMKKQLVDRENAIAEISWQQSHLYRGPLSTALGIVDLLTEEISNRSLSDSECAKLIFSIKDKLNELDHVVHSISKQTYR